MKTAPRGAVFFAALCLLRFGILEAVLEYEVNQIKNNHFGKDVCTNATKTPIKTIN